MALVGPAYEAYPFLCWTDIGVWRPNACRVRAASEPRSSATMPSTFGPARGSSRRRRTPDPRPSRPVAQVGVSAVEPASGLRCRRSTGGAPTSASGSWPSFVDSRRSVSGNASRLLRTLNDAMTSSSAVRAWGLRESSGFPQVSRHPTPWPRGKAAGPRRRGVLRSPFYPERRDGIATVASAAQALKRYQQRRETDLRTA